MTTALKPLRHFLFAVASYVLTVTAGSFLALVTLAGVGYLPYSDRPGPGWTTPSLDLHQLGFFASWSLFLFLPAAIWGLALAALGRLVMLASGKRWVVGSIGALAAALVTIVLVAATGWIIAIAGAPVLITAALAGGWGAFVLPRLSGRASLASARVRALFVCLVAGLLAAGYWVLFVPPYSQELAVQVVRFVPGPTTLSADNVAKSLPAEESQLLSKFLGSGSLHGGIAGSSGGGSAHQSARMLLVVTEPLLKTAHLRVPKACKVVYIQRNGSWTMYPANAATIRQRATIGPGPAFAFPDQEPSNFVWYPPVREGG